MLTFEAYCFKLNNEKKFYNNFNPVINHNEL